MKWFKPWSYTRQLLYRARVPLALMLILVVARAVLPLFHIPPEAAGPLKHVMDLLVIVTAFMTIQIAAKIGRALLYRVYDISTSDNIRQRRTRTQVDFIYRLALILTSFVAICVFLMTFESVRKVGASLIASAGVAGIVVGFAAQRSLSNLIAGFQVAFSQPIRIDDVVIVEKEWGRIEEINLTYVVVKLWDLRRLVVPLNYFIEKPFENWTRTSADILSHFFIYVDYTISVEAVRTQLMNATQRTPLWDKKVCLLQVTDFKEHCIELRVLVSARNASDAFDLSCFLREELLKDLVESLPVSAPKSRVYLQRPQGGATVAMATARSR